MSRNQPTIGRLATCGAVVLALLLAGAPAGAQSTRTKLSSAQSRATRVKSQYEKIAAAYAATEHNLDQTRGNISAARAGVSRAESDMEKLRGQLRDRVRAAYAMRGVGFFQFLLEAKSFRDFSLRFVSLQRQQLGDEGLILQLRRKRAELELRQRELKRQERVLTGEKASYEEQGRRLQISFSQANALVRELRGQLRLEEISRLFRMSSGGSVRGFVIPMDFCPVAGPHYVTNSFGAPRGGGTRRHQGNDIMSPKGTPVVAVVSGSVSRRTGGLGGNAYYLRGAGASFYYAHLNDFVAGDGAHVAAGQLIGHVGNTGNASGGPSHVHFEIHPGGGRAVDPYPSLVRVC
jgi:murein DD-endopeptidase MepM/ murein hydrolase activator NlpD